MIGKETFELNNNESLAPDSKSAIIQQDSIEKRRQDRRREVIKRNHQMAVAAYDLDVLIGSEDIRDIDDPKVQAILASLPEKYKPAFKKMAAFYMRQRQAIDEYETEMMVNVERDRQWGASIADANAYTGDLIFADLTDNNHQKPFGQIKFFRKEAYFVMIFSDDRDYAAAVRGRRAEIGMAEIEKSGGTYHNYVYLKYFKERYQGPIVMVRASQDVDQVITHERQHFINDKVFNNFFDTETGSRLKQDSIQKNRQAAYRHIKNEILAYLRDGSDGYRIFKSLHSPLYEHLYENLTPEDKVRATELIKEVADFISANHNRLHNPVARGILVYQLALVPLDEIPKWLTAIQETYMPRLQALVDFDLDIFLSGYWDKSSYHFITDYVLPSELDRYRQENLAQFRSLESEMQLIRDSVREIVFDYNLNADEVNKKLAGLADEYKKRRDEFVLLSQPLLQDGALKVAGIGNSLVYNYRENKLDAVDNNDIEIINYIKQQVVDAIYKYPRVELDKIRIFLSDNSFEIDDGQEAFDKFVKQIKSVIHQYNGSQPCWLEFMLDTDTDELIDFIDLEVEFRVPADVRNKGIKGALFNIKINGPRFVSK